MDHQAVTGEWQARPEDRWARTVRYGPYVLLAVGTVAALSTARLFPSGERYEVIVPLVLAAAVLHRVCVDTPWGGLQRPTRRAAYVVVRTAVAFVLTWLNPLFAFFAIVGYFDADEHVPRRWAWTVYLVTAVSVAGSQSGGLPPPDVARAGVFVGLLVVNFTLVVVFARITWGEADDAEKRTLTITELERANARLEQALTENARLHAELVDQAREAGVHDERERLAMEIHDTLAQGLTGIVTQLQAAEDTTDHEAARTHRRRAADLARSALGEARRSVKALVPAPLADGGLERALERLVADFRDDQRLVAELVVTGERGPLDGQVEATVVRVAQEALANVARHADATRVGVTVAYLDGEILLDVRDDGAGFDLSASRPDGPGGFGIAGMTRRAARSSGELVVESEPGRGTAVSLRVPAVTRA